MTKTALPKHLLALPGYAEHQRWLRDKQKEHHPECANLAKQAIPIELNGQSLRDYDFNGIILAEADLDGALMPKKVEAASFSYSSARGVRWLQSQILRCDLSDMDCSGGNFMSTVAQSVYFVDTNLDGAFLNGTVFIDCNLQRVSMRGAKGTPRFIRCVLDDLDAEGAEFVPENDLESADYK